jgi:phosphate-selective porin OprO/OprP
MNPATKLLAAAILAGLSHTAAAEITIDVIGGSEVSFEGLVQADGNWFNSDEMVLNGDTTDGTDKDMGMRRAELVLKGKGPGMWTWVAGYDARADKFLDVNVGYRFSGFTTLTVGQFKQPNSLEELSSTKNNDFVSKAMTTNLQAVARRMGVSLVTGGDNWSVTGSVFDRELTRRLANGPGYGVRGTFAPINEAGSLLHLGGSYVNYKAEDLKGEGNAQFRVRPDADFASQRLVDSGKFSDADRIATLGGEAAWVHGPFKLQAEVMRTNVGRDTHNDYDFDSWYVSGVWNVKGETWGYKNGVITTNLPEDPAGGMWQLGARYDHVDLYDDDTAVDATHPQGKESNWTLGVNYYWRSNFKFMLNYVKVDSHREVFDALGVQSTLHDDPSIVEFRAQLYW